MCIFVLLCLAVFSEKTLSNLPNRGCMLLSCIQKLTCNCRNDISVCTIKRCVLYMWRDTVLHLYIAYTDMSLYSNISVYYKGVYIVQAATHTIQGTFVIATATRVHLTLANSVRGCSGNASKEEIHII